MISNIIQIWHLGECNINFYCTLKNDIALSADIARNQSAIFVLLYALPQFAKYGRITIK